MRKRLSTAAVFFVITAGAALASSEKGVVVGLTPDTITIENYQGTVTYKVCSELLTNAPRDRTVVTSDKFSDVKKGDKIDLEIRKSGADFICTEIHFCRPDDAGTVTEVGKDTITIRNGQGKTAAYKVTEESAKTTWPDAVYTCIYPSRFSEVKKGCKIEFRYYKKEGDFVISQIDVKKDNEKNKDK
jgi:hypothetical protein